MAIKGKGLKFFKNLRISHKLLTGYIVVIAITSILGFLSIRSLQSMDKLAQYTNKTTIPSINIAHELSFEVARHRSRMFQYMTTTDKKGVQDITKKLSQTEADAVAKHKEYEPLIEDDSERKIFDSFGTAWESYVQEANNVKALIAQGKVEQARELNTKVARDKFEEALKAATALVDMNSENAKTSAQTASATFKSNRSLVIYALAASIILSILIALITARGLSRPIQQIVHVMGKCSEGDTSETVDIDTKEEIGQMASSFRTLIGYQKEMADAAKAIASGDLTRDIHPKSEKDTLGVAFREMTENLRGMVKEVAMAAENVASGCADAATSSEQATTAATNIAQSIQQVALASDNAAQGSSQIAEGSEHLARIATDAATSMDKLQNGAGEVAMGATKQQEAVEEALAAVEEGNKAVEMTVKSMDRIQHQVQVSSETVAELGQKGEQIGSIVVTIEEIAQQTNLLALNAAIEAARAGEQGKGFAVVAEEVRKLAERAASATHEISELINGVKTGVHSAVSSMEVCGQEVQQGSELSAKAGEALLKITSAAKSVGEQGRANLGHIDAMVADSKDVAEAISSAASVSEESAATAEELSATAQQVSASAQDVSAATEEQTAGLEEINSSLAHLSSMARNLQSMVAQFRVEDSEIASKKPESNLRLSA